MSAFIFGFLHPFRCTGLFLKHPKLILYSIVPMVINLIIYGAIFFFVYDWITGMTGNLEVLSKQENILVESLRILVKVASFLLVLLVCYFLFVIFGGIVSAPFNEFISKYVEEKVFGIRNVVQLPFVKEVLVSIREESKKLLFYFSVIIPLFAINFIPMIGSAISFGVGTPFSAYYNALDFMDYPMTRNGAVFKQKLGIINKKLSLSLGFGSIAFLMTFLPIINVIMKPLLVVAGTSLFYLKQYDTPSVIAK